MNPAGLFDHQLILLATPRQIGVLNWRPGQMHWLGEFAADKGGLAGFHQVILKHAKLPVLLVVDTVDEDYRGDILPHVLGRARDELLARKLKQVFRNARFMGAWRQAREAIGRRDDRYLFAALTDADWLTPWLSILHREKVPLSGITPLALACQHLLHKLRLHEPHTLLACRLNNSLRLSYYHDGLLRFSRLIGGDTPTQLPSNAADEITKTQLYLSGQRILPREARLHVLLLDPSGQLDNAQAPLNADPAFSARLIDIATLARALRIPDSFLADTPDIAPLAAIAGEAMQLNLAPPELLLHHTEFRWRRGLHTAAGLIALLGIGITAAYWLHAQDLNDQTRQLSQQQLQLDARYQAIARSFPTQATTPEIAPLAAIAGEALQLNLAPPELLQHHTEFRWRRGLHAAAGFITLLGVGATAAYWLHAQDLDNQTRQLTQQQLQLDARYQAIARSFPIQAATPEKLAQTVALARQLNTPEPDAYALMAAISQAVQAAPLIRIDTLSWTNALDSMGPTTITLDAALTPFDGNYRAAMQHIENFIQTLQAIPALHNVSLKSSPVNADSSQTLSGKTFDANLADAPAARFSLNLEYRPEPGEAQP